MDTTGIDKIVTLCNEKVEPCEKLLQPEKEKVAMLQEVLMDKK